MLKRINQCDVFVGLWCIYMSQEVLYSPGIINQAIQLIMLLWSLTALFRYIINLSNYSYSPILKATFFLIVMYAIYGTIHILYGVPVMGHSQYLYLQDGLNSLVPIFLFYDFTMTGKLTSDRIRIYLPILVVVCIFLYYRIENQMLLQKGGEEITNNAGYFFVPLIPFLFFYSKKPILQFAFWGIILLYVFMGMKRGAILIGVLGSVILLYANLKESPGRGKILFLILTIIIVAGISKYIVYMMSNSAYFMARFEDTLEGNTSGRDVIYETLWNTLLLESSPFYFYFGRGAESTVSIVGKLAHQDWLEIFCNNGLIGVLVLFFFFYTLGKNAWNSRHSFSGMMFYSFVTLFIIILSKTLFSMSIQNLELFSTMLIGYFAFELYNLEQCDNDETYD